MLNQIARKFFKHTFTDGAASLLFPLTCRVCATSLESGAEIIACPQCWQATISHRNNFDACEKCDSLLSKLQREPQLRSCGKCEQYSFTCARACGSYTKAIRESVMQLKSSPYLSSQLQKLLLSTFERLPNAPEISCVLPVPLHPNRQRARTYNQAEVIAQHLAQKTKLPINHFSLIRAIDTERHRAGMDEKARATSLKKAFQVRASRLITGQNILLIDDVMTTGATAHEIAGTLLQAGAQTVSVLTLARAVTIHH